MTYSYSDRLKDLGGNAIREIFKLLKDPEVISFAGGFPTLSTLPTKAVAEITTELMSRADGPEILQYGGTEGYYPLRETACEYVKRFGIEGIVPENTMVISGGQQGIDLMCKAFLNKGDVVLVEDPTYLAVLHILKTYEAQAVGVKSGDDGLDLADLEAKIQKYKPKFLYVVPTFSNPTGRTYSVENRKAIAELTARYDLMVVEDDPYSRLRFEGEHVPSLMSVKAADNVVFVTSFSKIIAPGLRTGIAVGPKEVIAKMTVGKQAVDVHTSSLSQAIVNEFLSRGMLDKHIAGLIPVYKEKKDAMLSAMAQHMPEEMAYTKPEGGLFIWGEIDPKTGFNAEKKFAACVSACKVAYVAGSSFYADGSGAGTLRLNYSNASVAQIQTGIEKLGAYFKQEIAGGGRA